MIVVLGSEAATAADKRSSGSARRRVVGKQLGDGVRAQGVRQGNHSESGVRKRGSNGGWQPK